MICLGAGTNIIEIMGYTSKLYIGIVNHLCASNFGVYRVLVNIQSLFAGNPSLIRRLGKCLISTMGNRN